jgi:tripartite motif-containing protein 71
MEHFFKGGFGTIGEGDGQFSAKFFSTGATGIAVFQPTGDLYVGDNILCRIQKFSKDGQFLGIKWGSEGTADGQFRNPTGIAVDSDSFVYVTDTDNNRVQKFTEDGTFVKSWGGQGTEDGKFNVPVGIAVMSNNDILVVDSMNFRIQKFSSSGQFKTKWKLGDDTAPSPDLELAGIAVDSEDNNYVAMGNRSHGALIDNNCVQKFDFNGNFIKRWGRIGENPGEFDAAPMG